MVSNACRCEVNSLLGMCQHLLKRLGLEMAIKYMVFIPEITQEKLTETLAGLKNVFHDQHRENGGKSYYENVVGKSNTNPQRQTLIKYICQLTFELMTKVPERVYVIKPDFLSLLPGLNKDAMLNALKLQTGIEHQLQVVTATCKQELTEIKTIAAKMRECYASSIHSRSTIPTIQPVIITEKTGINENKSTARVPSWFKNQQTKMAENQWTTVLQKKQKKKVKGKEGKEGNTDRSIIYGTKVSSKSYPTKSICLHITAGSSENVTSVKNVIKNLTSDLQLEVSLTEIQQTEQGITFRALLEKLPQSSNSDSYYKSLDWPFGWKIRKWSGNPNAAIKKRLSVYLGRLAPEQQLAPIKTIIEQLKDTNFTVKAQFNSPRIPKMSDGTGRNIYIRPFKSACILLESEEELPTFSAIYEKLFAFGWIVRHWKGRAAIDAERPKTQIVTIDSADSNTVETTEYLAHKDAMVTEDSENAQGNT